MRLYFSKDRKNVIFAVDEQNYPCAIRSLIQEQLSILNEVTSNLPTTYYHIVDSKEGRKLFMDAISARGLRVIIFYQEDIDLFLESLIHDRSDLRHLFRLLGNHRTISFLRKFRERQKKIIKDYRLGKDGSIYELILDIIFNSSLYLYLFCPSRKTSKYKLLKRSKKIMGLHKSSMSAKNSNSSFRSMSKLIDVLVEDERSKFNYEIVSNIEEEDSLFEALLNFEILHDKPYDVICLRKNKDTLLKPQILRIINFNFSRNYRAAFDDLLEYKSIQQLENFLKHKVVLHIDDALYWRRVMGDADFYSLLRTVMNTFGSVLIDVFVSNEDRMNEGHIAFDFISNLLRFSGSQLVTYKPENFNSRIVVLISKNTAWSPIRQIFRKKGELRLKSDQNLNHNQIKKYFVDEILIKSLARGENRDLEEEMRNEVRSNSILSSRGFIGFSEADSNPWELIAMRPYIHGIELTNIQDKSNFGAAIYKKACEFSKLGLYPNDLRPWNIIVTNIEFCEVEFIDFPNPIDMDQDVAGISNALALLATLDYLSHGDMNRFKVNINEFRRLLKDNSPRINLLKLFNFVWCNLTIYESIFLDDNQDLVTRFNHLIDKALENA